jgi:hypothetical protein
MNKISNSFKPSIEKNYSYQIIHIESFDESINSFWDRVKDSYDFIIERRREYLNWRYCDPRLQGYKINIAQDEYGDIKGYIVYKINDYVEEYSIGYIVDILSLGNCLDVQYGLIQNAVDYFRENKVNVVNYQLVAENPTKDMLNRFGFIDSRINLHLFYNKYGEFRGLDNLIQSAPDRIHVSWGDHDALPVKMPTQT